MPRIIAAAAVAAAATRKSHTKALSESADSVLRSNVEVARTLPATTKLICGLVDEITCDELGELFVALGSTAEGNLSFTTFALLLRKVVGLGTEAIDELQGCLGIDEAGMVSEKALLACLQDGGRAEEILRHRDERESNPSGIPKHGLSFEFFTEKVAWRVRRDDSFSTLPVTLIYTIVFISIVIHHLDILTRQRIYVGLHSWVVGYGGALDGPYLMDHVSDESDFWNWMRLSGVDAVLCGSRLATGCNYIPAVGPQASPRIMLANSQVFIGDARLVRLQENDVQSQEWLLHSKVATEHLSRNRTDYVGAAQRTIAELEENTWLGYNTASVTLEFCTYSEVVKRFAITRVKVKFVDLGYVHVLVTVRATPVYAYDDPALWLIDVLYISILLFKASFEMKDMCGSLRHSWTTFIHYWNYQNFVDWSLICMGALNIIAWIRCWLAMHDSAVRSLLTDDGVLAVSPLDLHMNQISSLMDALSHTDSCFFMLHLSFMVSTISLVGLFFKAFEANLRLQVIPDVLEKTAVSIVHFFVVFLTLFFCFVTMGHVLFGCDVVEFATLASSVNTCMFMLVGVFDWYADLLNMARPLPSGLPLPVLQLWFTVYLLFMMLVLLSMLLAVVVDAYPAVNEKAIQIDGNPIWTQARNFMNRKMETFRHQVSLQHIQRVLENSNTKIELHEGVVTRDSLVDAFPTMTHEQADWLHSHFTKEMQKDRRRQDAEEAALRTKRAKHSERLMQLAAGEVHSLSGSIEQHVVEIAKTQEWLNKLLRVMNPEGSMADANAINLGGIDVGNCSTEIGNEGNLPPETLLAEEPHPFIESVQELADSSGHDSSCMPCLGEHCMVFPK